MVSMPRGEESVDMGFGVGFTIAADIGVQHGVVLTDLLKIPLVGFLGQSCRTDFRAQSYFHG